VPLHFGNRAEKDCYSSSAYKLLNVNQNAGPVHTAAPFMAADAVTCIGSFPDTLTFVVSPKFTSFAISAVW